MLMATSGAGRSGRGGGQRSKRPASTPSTFRDLRHDRTTQCTSATAIYLHSYDANKLLRFRLHNFSDHYQLQLLISCIGVLSLLVCATVSDCAPLQPSHQQHSKPAQPPPPQPPPPPTAAATAPTATNASQPANHLPAPKSDHNSTGAAYRQDAANMKEINALTYLQKFGYMSETFSTTANLVTELSFQSAIKSFQRFAGLNESGLLDNKTQYFMRVPRCGNKDLAAPSAQPLGSQRATFGQPLWLSGGGHAHHPHTAHQARGNRSRRANLGSLVGPRRRKKRYALQGSKWRRQELTYRISQYPTRYLNRREEVDQQIAMAFGVWSQVAPIDFIVKRDGRVHIDIRFASGDHGDGDAFDGPGNTLAHAYFPQYGGDAHFDDQEYWTIDSYAGTNIFQVAAHELGHSLGLGHSSVREALMAPFYQKYKPNFKIHEDDIMAIQALYGTKSHSMDPMSSSSSFNYHAAADAATSTTTTSTTTTSTTTSTSRPSLVHGRRHETNDDDLATNQGGADGGQHETIGANDNSDDQDDDPLAGPQLNLCADSRMDTVTRTEDGQSYVFKGDHYWLLTADGVAKDYPRRISADWDGLPGNLNAALTWADGKTFFFKGNKYWRFRNKKRDNGYPKLISTGFAGIPNDIDAAFVWSGNGRTYIFKGAQYWRFDSKSEPPVSSEYPRSIKVWSGIPAHIDAAFKWDNNITYFFKGNQYYRFNDHEFKVEPRGRPQFPRPTGEWWFGCTASNLAQKRLPFSGGLGNAPDGRPYSLEDELRREPLSPSLWAQDNDNLDMNVRNEMIETDDTNSLWSLHSDSDTTSPKIYGTHINDATISNDAAATAAPAKLVPTERGSNNHYYFKLSSSSSSASQFRTGVNSVSYGACLLSLLLMAAISSFM